MFFSKSKSLVSILDKSPFFTELSIKEREKLIGDLLKQYPHLYQQYNSDAEVGYETSWFANRSY
jgi:hypothetical protein